MRTSNVETAQPASTEHRQSPDAIAQQAEDRGQVRAALERLSAKDRTILVMRELEGLDYATISTNLKIRMGTVRSRLFRARGELRRQLSDYYHNAIPRKSPSVR